MGPQVIPHFIEYIAHRRLPDGQQTSLPRQSFEDIITHIQQHLALTNKLHDLLEIASQADTALGSLLWDHLGPMMLMQTQFPDDLWPLATHHPRKVYEGPARGNTRPLAGVSQFR